MARLDPASVTDSALPARFGRYELLAVLGRGGLGRVFKADLIGPAGFRKRVALKVLHKVVRRHVNELVHEARLGGLMAHPNVVDTYELGEHEGAVYIAMELVRGPTLSALLRTGGPLSPLATVQLLLQVCAGLDHAHSLQIRGQHAGLVHRDLKPANLLITPEGLVKVADFGIAVLTADGPKAAAGTPGYMAPEQSVGDAVDRRTDLFSLGVIGWECLAGRRLLRSRGGQPDRVGGPIGLERKLDHPDFTGPIEAVCPEALPILRSCLRLDLAARPPSASALADALRSLPPPAGPSLAGVLVERGMGTSAVQAVHGYSPSALSETPTPVRRLAARHNLGAEVDAFFGREAELESLLELVHGPGRIVVLKGPGGAGKTRLSRRAAAASASRLAGGAWFVELADATEPEAILRAVLQVLDLSGGGDPEARVGAALAERSPILLVLDNAEQAVEHVAALVSRWHAAAPEARLLVTSRERLRLKQERVVELGELQPDAAVALFEERARERGWRPEPEDRQAIEQIVAALDRMPLAIELAAARARLLPPRALLARLEDRFRVLRSGARDLPTRQLSLYGAIEGSWEACTPAEQATLAQLSCFTGGFTLHAAEQVVDLSAHPDAPWVMELVEALLDRSLLAATPGREPRFRLLESIRQFASTKLEDAGSDEVGRAQLRHATYYAELTQPLLHDVHAPDHLRRVRALWAEVDNLVPASRGMLARGHPGLAVLLALGAALAVQHRGPYQSAVRLLREVREATGLSGDLAVAAAHFEVDLSHASGDLEGMRAATAAVAHLAPETLGPGPRIRLLRARGLVALMLSEWEEATALFSSALEAATDSDRWLDQASCLRELGVLAFRGGDLIGARDQFGRALEIQQRYSPGAGVLSTRINLANVIKELGETREAERLYASVVAEAKELGQTGHQATALGNLGVVLAHQGQLHEAVAAYREAIALHRQAGAGHLLGVCQLYYSAALLTLGRRDDALEQAQQATPRMRQSGSPLWLGVSLCAEGRALLALGRHHEARTQLERALELGTASHTAVIIGVARRGLGEAALEAGRADEAREHADQAAGWLDRSGDVAEQLLGRCLEVALLAAEGAPDRARSALDALAEEARAHQIGEHSDVGQRIRALAGQLP